MSEQQINDGGPAFPESPGRNNGEMGRCGMSLRDYFAAKAMVGIYQMIATGAHGVNASDIEGGIADQAYNMADAMLKARQS